MAVIQSSVPARTRNNIAFLVALFQLLTWPLSAWLLLAAYMGFCFGQWILSAAAGAGLLLFLAIPVVVAVAWVRHASPGARHVSVSTTILADLGALAAVAYPALLLWTSVAHGELWALVALAMAAYAGTWLGCGWVTSARRSEPRDAPLPGEHPRSPGA